MRAYIKYVYKYVHAHVYVRMWMYARMYTLYCMYSMYNTYVHEMYCMSFGAQQYDIKYGDYVMFFYCIHTYIHV